MRYLFEIHTLGKMYNIMAAYFAADSDGVMFFDEKDNGIGFAPNTNLEFARLSPPLPDPSELMKVKDWFKKDA